MRSRRSTIPVATAPEFPDGYVTGRGDLTLMGGILPEDGGGVISTCAGGRHCALLECGSIDQARPRYIKAAPACHGDWAPAAVWPYPLLAPTELPSMGCWLSALSGVLDEFGDKVKKPLIRPISYVSNLLRHDPARRD
jgi:hypothetical protein